MNSHSLKIITGHLLRLFICLFTLSAQGENIRVVQNGRDSGPNSLDDRQPFDLEQARVWPWWGDNPIEPQKQLFFGEYLPAIFKRTLVFKSLTVPAREALEWVFTGSSGGVTIRVHPDGIQVVQRYYDSFALNDPKQPARYPQRVWQNDTATINRPITNLSVELDDRLQIVVTVNDGLSITQRCLLDFQQHQVKFINTSGKQFGKCLGVASGWLIRPQAKDVRVTLEPQRQFQKMIGFGGTTIPTAYNELSANGKRRWWELICEYNLLVQREFPVNRQLNEAMNNWNDLAIACPHYYGDSFPNGEISDFEYLRQFRLLGGQVWFELWAMPSWMARIEKDEKGDPIRVVDSKAYARAIVAYCRMSQTKAGAPPDVVGIQNEMTQTPEAWNAMTIAVRKAMDEAGFSSIKIHLPDAWNLKEGIRRLPLFQKTPAVWDKIDYTACHFYDYQSYFQDPDAFDAMLAQWRQLRGEKPFLSTEICVNEGDYQVASYRLAMALGSLYYKNLLQLDASALCYCWMILNVTQPSFGWTRTLFIIDRANGFMPVPSSHSLRVFGAFSRRIKRDMVRFNASTSDPNLLVVAFAGKNGARTVVLFNRSLHPMRAALAADGAEFTVVEKADPYAQNQILPPPERMEGEYKILVEPGSFVTLSSAPLGQLPANFTIPIGRSLP